MWFQKQADSGQTEGSDTVHTPQHEGHQENIQLQIAEMSDMRSRRMTSKKEKWGLRGHWGHPLHSRACGDANVHPKKKPTEGKEEG